VFRPAPGTSHRSQVANTARLPPPPSAGTSAVGQPWRRAGLPAAATTGSWAANDGHRARRDPPPHRWRALAPSDSGDRAPPSPPRPQPVRGQPTPASGHGSSQTPTGGGHWRLQEAAAARRLARGGHCRCVGANAGQRARVEPAPHRWRALAPSGSRGRAPPSPPRPPPVRGRPTPASGLGSSQLPTGGGH